MHHILNIFYFKKGKTMKYLLLISVLPSIILLLFIYTNDKIEKESKRLILKLFVFGLIMAPIIGEFENFFGNFNTEIG